MGIDPKSNNIKIFDDGHRDPKEHSKYAEEYSRQLISEGSWWGSRAWAHLNLFGLGQQRQLRLKMLSFADNFRHVLYNIENELMGVEVDGIAKAVRRMLKLMNEYNAVFIPIYNALINLMRKAETPQLGEGESEKSNKSEELEKFDEPEKHDESKFKVKKDNESKKPTAREISADAHKKLVYIYKSHAKLEAQFKAIIDAKAPSEIDKSLIAAAWVDYISASVNVQGLNITHNSLLSDEQIVLVNDLINSFSKVVSIIKNITNKYYNNWSEVVNDSNLSKADEREFRTRRN